MLIVPIGQAFSPYPLLFRNLGLRPRLVWDAPLALHGLRRLVGHATIVIASYGHSS